MILFVIFLVLVAFILTGVPIAVGMGITSVITFIALGEGNLLVMMAQRMYSATTGFTLLAIPFFIMAGSLMNTCGITTRIFKWARVSVGHIWGGLGQVNVVASMVFSGMSGSAIADAAGLGAIELKAMNESGYDPKFSAAITAASSTIGPVIPPSIPFVIYGSITGVSVGKLFLAGVSSGLLMGLAMMIAVAIISKRRNYPKDKKASARVVLLSFKDALLPLMTPVIIIGGILGGLFTPTEAAIVACIYALILGTLVYKEITLKDIPRIFYETTVQSIKVMFVISVAGFFGWLLIHQRIPNIMIIQLTALSSNPMVILLIIIGVLLVLGCFIEGIAVLVITVPVFMPVITQIGIDPVQFGVIMILASMIGLITPPVGMSLYAVAGISNIKVGVLAKELIPYLIGITLVMLIVAFFPIVTLWLPNLIFN